MLYLIDDKKVRQDKYAPFLKNEEYNKTIKCIYNYSELNQLKENILSSKTKCIGFHDSFFKNPINKLPDHLETALKQFIKLEDYCENHNIPLVTFSGDFSITKINTGKYTHTLPVDTLYRNLKPFLDEYISKGKILVDILAYGKYYDYEEASIIRERIHHFLFKIEENEKIIFKAYPTDFRRNIIDISNLLNLADKMNLEEKIKIGNLLKRQLLLEIDNGFKNKFSL